jgi:starvation-inducible DNA-binding protein
MNNKPVIEALKNALSDTYLLYLKTQNYHWNVEGPQFRSLHLMFEEQYTDLAMAIDQIAETIRSLGEKAPGTFDSYAKRSHIKSGNEEAPAEQMLKDLAVDQVTIGKTLQTLLEAAQKAEDEVSADLAIQRMTIHRKNKWMLESLLK